MSLKILTCHWGSFSHRCSFPIESAFSGVPLPIRLDHLIGLDAKLMEHNAAVLDHDSLARDHGQPVRAGPSPHPTLQHEGFGTLPLSYATIDI